jgi:S1-C subfamily serine protease
MRYGRLAAVAAVAAVIGGLSLVNPLTHASAYGASPADTSANLRQAGTIAKPSVVLVQVEESAYVKDDRYGNTTYDQTNSAGGVDPFTATFIGTGFFISSDGYIVTAAHLAAPSADDILADINIQYLAEDAVVVGNCGATDQPCIDAFTTQNEQDYLLHSTLIQEKTTITVFTQNMTSVDQALPGELKSSSPMGQRDTAVIKVSTTNAPVLLMGDSSTVQDSDPISIMGYPSTAFTSSNLQGELTPTLTTGAVTAHKTGGGGNFQGLANGVNVLQTDTMSTHGNSGGPAIDSNGKVIGIVSYGDPSSTNTGFLITSNDVRDVIKQAAATNVLGPIDNLWRQGLTDYNGSHYKAAAPIFHNCAELNPMQVGCVSYEQLATAKFSKDVPISPPSSGSGMTIIFIIIGVVVVAGVVLAIVLMKRRSPGAAIATAGGPSVPVTDVSSGMPTEPPAPRYAPAAPAPAPPVAPAPPPPAASAPPPPAASAPPPPVAPSPPPPAASAPPPPAASAPAPPPPAAPPASEAAPGATAPPTAPEPDVAAPKGNGEAHEVLKFCPECGNGMEGHPFCGKCGYRP